VANLYRTFRYKVLSELVGTVLALKFYIVMCGAHGKKKERLFKYLEMKI